MTRSLQIRVNFVSMREGCILALIAVRIVMTMSGAGHRDGTFGLQRW
jgi:hypothetical protein